jgi:hypothetical protein
MRGLRARALSGRWRRRRATGTRWWLRAPGNRAQPGRQREAWQGKEVVWPLLQNGTGGQAAGLVHAVATAAGNQAGGDGTMEGEYEAEESSPSSPANAGFAFSDLRRTLRGMASDLVRAERHNRLWVLNSDVALLLERLP